MKKINRRDFSKKIAMGAAGLTAAGSGLVPLQAMTGSSISMTRSAEATGAPTRMWSSA